MKLYHYTYNENILKEGLDAYYKHPDTIAINDLIINKFGECFGRDYCIFFNLNKVDNGDIIVSVDSSSLDIEQLFVANQDLADDIYRNLYRGNNCDSLIDDYVNSIMVFDNYNGEYENPEVFYTDSIPANLLKIEE